MLIMKRTTLFPLLVALVAVMTVFGCKKDEDTVGEVSLEFEYKVGDQAFAYNQNYTIGGTVVSFETVQFYAGGLELHPETGEHTAFDQYLLVKPAAGELKLGELKKGHYHELNFFVGVEPSINSQTTADFTSRPATDPLSIQSPNMHWSWNSGYIFFRVDGQVDADGDGTPEKAMQFHIGTDAMLRNQAFDMHDDLDQEDNHVHLKLDVAKLFTGIDLKTEYLTHTGDGLPLATKFADNIATALSVE